MRRLDTDSVISGPIRGVTIALGGDIHPYTQTNRRTSQLLDSIGLRLIH